MPPGDRVFRCVIPGPPKAWERATVHQGRTLTSKAMRQAKAHVRSCLSAEALRQRWQPAAEPVRLTLAFVRRRKPDAVPDGDNLSKMVMDCGNGIVWDDDCRVVELHAVKRRPGDGEDERTIVTVEVLSEEGS